MQNKYNKSMILNYDTIKKFWILCRVLYLLVAIGCVVTGPTIYGELNETIGFLMAVCIFEVVLLISCLCRNMKYELLSRQIITDIFELTYYPKYAGRTSVIFPMVISVVVDILFVLLSLGLYADSFLLTSAYIFSDPEYTLGMSLVIIYCLYGTIKATLLFCCIPLYYYETRNSDNRDAYPYLQYV